MWPFRKCLHDWSVINEVMLPSAFEQITASGHTLKGDDARMMIFEKHHAVLVSCKKCGELRRFETTNI